MRRDVWTGTNQLLAREGEELEVIDPTIHFQVRVNLPIVETGLRATGLGILVRSSTGVLVLVSDADVDRVKVV